MRLSFLRCALAVSVLMLGACSKSGPPEASTPQEAASGVKDAFAKASPEVKRMAEAASASLNSEQTIPAFLGLHQMAARPDLTPEQRQAVAGAIISASQTLQKAAEKGDKTAAELLESYARSK